MPPDPATPEGLAETLIRGPGADEAAAGQDRTLPPPAEAREPQGLQDTLVPPAGAGAPDEPSVAPRFASTPFGPPARPGEVGTLGPYRVVKLLGKGGMGAVYAALDTRLTRKLALKVMRPELAHDEEARERFLREGRAAARVAHDNVVTIYEADERNGAPYIAMQFLEGCSLANYLARKGDPTVAQVLRVARETASGLQAAHKRGLVHRDIKPANLWLEAPGGRVKILDFGLVKPVKAEAQLTADGVVLGTPAYMSPEQAQGEKVDHRTDLYSLGAVLYRLCAGRPPYEAPTPMETLLAIASGPPAPVRALNPQVPAALAELIDQLLARAPADRPADAEEVVRRVRALMAPLAANAQGPAAEASAAMSVSLPLETGPFARLDDTERLTEGVVSARKRPGGPRPAKAARKQGARALWLAAGLAGAGLVLGLVALLVALAGKGKEAEPGDKAGRKAKAPDPDRQAAEWALSLGGAVRVNGQERDIRVAANLPKGRFTLTRVTLDKKAVTDDDLANLRGLKGLAELWLKGAKVTDEGLVRLEGLEGLLRLVVSDTEVTDAGLARLENFRDLQTLGLDGTRVTDAGLARLKEAPALEVLWLSRTAVTDAGLAWLQGAPALAQLDLSDTAVTDAGLARLKVCKRLSFLDVRRTRVTAKGVSELRAALPACRIDHDTGAVAVKATDPDRRAAEWALSLGGTVITQKREVRARDDLPKERFALTGIDLTGKPVAGGDLANLKGLKGLTLLRLKDTPVTDEGLGFLKDSRGLMVLQVGGSRVTDAGLDRITGMQGLRQIGLNGTKVTDAGLDRVKEIKGLNMLWLANTAVTDAGLARLKECKRLTFLDVRMTKVTAKGLADLHGAVPGCRIEHDGGVIEAKK